MLFGALLILPVLPSQTGSRCRDAPLLFHREPAGVQFPYSTNVKLRLVKSPCYYAAMSPVTSLPVMMKLENTCDPVPYACRTRSRLSERMRPVSRCCTPSAAYPGFLAAACQPVPRRSSLQQSPCLANSFLHTVVPSSLKVNPGSAFIPDSHAGHEMVQKDSSPMAPD